MCLAALQTIHQLETKPGSVFKKTNFRNVSSNCVQDIFPAYLPVGWICSARATTRPSRLLLLLPLQNSSQAVHRPSSVLNLRTDRSKMKWMRRTMAKSAKDFFFLPVGEMAAKDRGQKAEGRQSGCVSRDRARLVGAREKQPLRLLLLLLLHKPVCAKQQQRERTHPPGPRLVGGAHAVHPAWTRTRCTCMSTGPAAACVIM